MHYQVAQATGGRDCIIYFTKKSTNDSFLENFKKSACQIKDISKWTDNKWLYFLNLIYRGIITGYINRQEQTPIVFNGQCNFGYKISPWVKKNIRQIELIHSFNSFSFIRNPFLPFIETTVMISKKRIEDHIQFYDKIKAPVQFMEKIRYVQNAVDLPVQEVPKDFRDFRVLYVGRGGKEKRVHLVAAIADKVHEKDPTIKFEILGDVSEVLNKQEWPLIHFYGDITDEKKISEIYKNASVLLLTSITEGFPMVVMEAMAHGCAVIATAVGDIPHHLKENVNGFLFSSIENEEKIVSEGAQEILKLKNDHELLNSICKNNSQYAQNNFSIEQFNQAYRHIFETGKK